MAEAQYQRLTALLVAAIEDGTYGVGSKLPTEGELCTTHGLSRFTVREALRSIEQLGLIRRHRGRASDVIASQRRAGYTVTLTSESEFARLASNVAIELRDGPTTPSKRAAGRLGLGDPEQWLRWRGVRHQPDVEYPTALVEMYLAAEFADVVDHVPVVLKEPVFFRLEATHGVVLSHMDQWIMPSSLKKLEADRLRTSVDTLALRVVNSFYSTSNQLFEVMDMLHPSPSYKATLRVEWPNRSNRQPSGDNPLRPNEPPSGTKVLDDE